MRGKGVGMSIAARGFENRGQHAFGERIDVLRPNERGFDVDLGELRLAIGAQIFVAETVRDLEIFFHPADHEELLVLLRRLRERVKLSRPKRLGTRKSRAPSGVLLERIGVSISRKPWLVEIIAGRLRDAMTNAQVARQLRAAQVEIAIGQRRSSF